MNKGKIILLCVFAAVTYGVLHDQVTVRVCIEYFTVAHPPLFRTSSPTLLALCWGVAATIGIGGVLGIVLSFVADSGTAPRIPFARLRRRVAWLLGIMAMAAFLAGLLGYILALRGVVSIPAAFTESIPAGQHHRFMAVWFTHLASYLVGLGGGAQLILRTWRDRGRPVLLSAYPRSPMAIIRATIVAAIAAYVLWIRFVSH